MNSDRSTVLARFILRAHYHNQGWTSKWWWLSVFCFSFVGHWWHNCLSECQIIHSIKDYKKSCWLRETPRKDGKIQNDYVLKLKPFPHYCPFVCWLVVFPHKGLTMWPFDVFFDASPSKLMNKQLRFRWLEKMWHSLILYKIYSSVFHHSTVWSWAFNSLISCPVRIHVPAFRG